ASAAENPCRKFQANIFNKSKCQNCFKPRESHLLNDEDLTQVSGRRGAVANSLSFCSLHPALHPPPHPHGSIRKPQPIGSHQSSPSPCFLLALPPRAYFRPSRLEDRSRIIQATSSLRCLSVSCSPMHFSAYTQSSTVKKNLF
uniref:Uncharacterized protein n=1 Tax=Capra hircus TaxID=9925 RepID=A0A8C2P849_CAPHI